MISIQVHTPFSFGANTDIGAYSALYITFENAPLSGGARV